MTAKPSITEYRPDGSGNLSEQVYDLDAIRELPANVKHIKITGDGGLEIVLSAKATKEGNELHKIRELLLMINGGVIVDFRPAQKSLPM